MSGPGKRKGHMPDIESVAMRPAYSALEGNKRGNTTGRLKLRDFGGAEVNERTIRPRTFSPGNNHPTQPRSTPILKPSLTEDLPLEATIRRGITR